MTENISVRSKYLELIGRSVAVGYVRTDLANVSFGSYEIPADVWAAGRLLRYWCPKPTSGSVLLNCASGGVCANQHPETVL